MKYKLSVLLLFTISSSAVYSAEPGSAPNPPAIDITESVSACKNLYENDDCQIHDKTNALATGYCKTKSVTNDNFALVCVPDKTKKPSTDSGETANENTNTHQHKRKQH